MFGKNIRIREAEDQIWCQGHKAMSCRIGLKPLSNQNANAISILKRVRSPNKLMILRHYINIIKVLDMYQNKTAYHPMYLCLNRKAPTVDSC